MNNQSKDATPNTTPMNTPNTITEGNLETNTSRNSSTDHGNTTHAGNRRNDRRYQFTGNELILQGDKAEIGGVLGLRTECLDKKCPTGVSWKRWANKFSVSSTMRKMFYWWYTTRKIRWLISKPTTSPQT
mmetsp:Transcript_52915/g.78441  ORF Transcript_52915/g.78441 Transcript_52915/m.78441 type:complete len:130 (+) Transcript_52915:68-457(+)